MNWPPLVPGPDALAEAPELATLHVLDVALVTTSNAMLAANVELQSDDFISELACTPSAGACLADAVLANVESLQRAVARYREHLAHRRRLAPFAAAAR
jgi:hypothetical protein